MTQGTSANTIDTDTTVYSESYESTGDDENALRVDGATVTLSGVTVSKSAGKSSNTEDGDFSAPGALKALEEKLAGRLFARCNSGYLVNLAQVSGVQQNTVQVGPHELQISRPKRRAFLAALADYIGGEGA